MAKSKPKKVFVRPPKAVKDMSDEELEQSAEDAVLTPLLGPEKAEDKRERD